MRSTLLFRYGGLFMFVILVSHFSSAQKKMTPKRITELKQEAANLVDQKAKMSQVMVDKIFSFAELGFQEVESSSYLTGF
ncbi:hypothetical protein SYJ56_16895 [Algoriphagus sp. D3-2-R+10]|uniref:hypothetical protein n=1 Tax=Algoriphagus aurantiacus TaxID=3103948 RepID=UPI002B3DB6A5|nr:hypothetical protein [Algoriphagus sp. D3-2-R+10]MEB2776997.1 hypothetical protein [Algoriphagus sp. D3-2-R+10]